MARLMKSMIMMTLPELAHWVLVVSHLIVKFKI